MTARNRAWRWLKKIPRAVGFMAFFWRELVLSSLQVAYDVITPEDKREPAIVSVPLDVRSDLGIALLANLVTLTPGTLALGLSTDRRELLVHAMFAPDDESLRHDIKDGYERRIMELLS
jgi:multicomponent Na+:H+ antiporter subunit E